MSEKKFELGDYVEVKDRIARLYEFFPQARIETSYELTAEPDAKPKVICRALVYRKPEDERPAGHGTSWLYLPGATPYTKGSEIENAETSAVGRAIGMLGILIGHSIATSNEIDNKRDETSTNGVISTREHRIDTSRTPEGGLVGTAVAQGTQDFELRQTPDGWLVPFRVKDGAKSFIVLAEGPIAQALASIKATVMGQRVTVWGRWTDETIPARGTKPEINYRALHLDRIATPDGILPAPAFDTPMPEALPDPIFDEDDEAVIDAALTKVAV